MLLGNQELRVDLREFQGQTSYAKYSSFQVSGEQEKYKLTLGQFLEGTAGKSHRKLEAVGGDVKGGPQAVPAHLSWAPPRPEGWAPPRP